jgi:hypothetical protein
VATLLVLASILIGFVSVFALRSFLTDRLDAQLAYALERSQAAVVPPMNNQNNPGNNNNANGNNGNNNGRDNNGNGGNGNDRNGNTDNRENTRGVLRAPGQSAGMLVAVVSESGAITAGILDRRGNPEIVPDGTLVTEDVVEAQQAGNRPFTLEAVGEGTFRAVSAATGTQISTAIGSTAVTNATNATNTAITTGSATTNYLTFVTATTGNLPQLTNTGLTYNGTTNAITGGISGGTF